MSEISSVNTIQENRAKYAKYFSDTSNDDMSMDTFYKLLTAEMTNQDPMEPMSNTEFISQMASFTSLQTQKDALYYNNANYAQSLVGKTVTVATVSGSNVYSDTGVVTSMNLTNGEFNVKVNGKSYSLSSIMEVMSSDNPYTVSGNDAAYATSLIGKQVTLSTVNSSGSTVVETGTVQRIEIKDTAITVIVGDLAYPLSSVVKIENPEETATGSNTGDDDSDDGDNETGTDTSDTKNTASANETTITNETKLETTVVTSQTDEPDLIDDSEELEALFG